MAGAPPLVGGPSGLPLGYMRPAAPPTSLLSPAISPFSDIAQGSSVGGAAGFDPLYPENAMPDAAAAPRPLAASAMMAAAVRQQQEHEELLAEAVAEAAKSPQQYLVQQIKETLHAPHPRLEVLCGCAADLGHILFAASPPHYREGGLPVISRSPLVQSQHALLLQKLQQQQAQEAANAYAMNLEGGHRGSPEAQGPQKTPSCAATDAVAAQVAAAEAEAEEAGTVLSATGLIGGSLVGQCLALLVEMFACTTHPVVRSSAFLQLWRNRHFFPYLLLPSQAVAAESVRRQFLSLLQQQQLEMRTRDMALELIADGVAPVIGQDAPLTEAILNTLASLWGAPASSPESCDGQASCGGARLPGRSDGVCRPRGGGTNSPSDASSLLCKEGRLFDHRRDLDPLVVAASAPATAALATKALAALLPFLCGDAAIRILERACAYVWSLQDGERVAASRAAQLHAHGNQLATATSTAREQGTAEGQEGNGGHSGGQTRGTSRRPIPENASATSTAVASRMRADSALPVCLHRASSLAALLATTSPLQPDIAVWALRFLWRLADSLHQAASAAVASSSGLPAPSELETCEDATRPAGNRCVAGIHASFAEAPSPILLEAVKDTARACLEASNFLTLNHGDLLVPLQLCCLKRVLGRCCCCAGTTASTSQAHACLSHDASGQTVSQGFLATTALRCLLDLVHAHLVLLRPPLTFCSSLRVAATSLHLLTSFSEPSPPQEAASRSLSKNSYDRSQALSFRLSSSSSRSSLFATCPPGWDSRPPSRNSQSSDPRFRRNETWAPSSTPSSLRVADQATLSHRELWIWLRVAALQGAPAVCTYLAVLSALLGWCLPERVQFRRLARATFSLVDTHARACGCRLQGASACCRDRQTRRLRTVASEARPSAPIGDVKLADDLRKTNLASGLASTQEARKDGTANPLTSCRDTETRGSAWGDGGSPTAGETQKRKREGSDGATKTALKSRKLQSGDGARLLDVSRPLATSPDYRGGRAARLPGPPADEQEPSGGDVRPAADLHLLNAACATFEAAQKAVAEGVSLTGARVLADLQQIALARLNGITPSSASPPSAEAADAGAVEGSAAGMGEGSAADTQGTEKTCDTSAESLSVAEKKADVSLAGESKKPSKATPAKKPESSSEEEGEEKEEGELSDDEPPAPTPPRRQDSPQARIYPSAAPKVPAVAATTSGTSSTAASLRHLPTAQGGSSMATAGLLGFAHGRVGLHGDTGAPSLPAPPPEGWCLEVALVPREAPLEARLTRREVRLPLSRNRCLRPLRISPSPRTALCCPDGEPPAAEGHRPSQESASAADSTETPARADKAAAAGCKNHHSAISGRPLCARSTFSPVLGRSGAGREARAANRRSGGTLAAFCEDSVADGHVASREDLKRTLELLLQLGRKSSQSPRRVRVLALLVALQAASWLIAPLPRRALEVMASKQQSLEETRSAPKAKDKTSKGSASVSKAGKPPGTDTAGATSATAETPSTRQAALTLVVLKERQDTEKMVLRTVETLADVLTDEDEASLQPLVGAWLGRCFLSLRAHWPSLLSRVADILLTRLRVLLPSATASERTGASKLAAPGQGLREAWALLCLPFSSPFPRVSFTQPELSSSLPPETDSACPFSPLSSDCLSLPRGVSRSPLVRVDVCLTQGDEAGESLKCLFHPALQGQQPGISLAEATRFLRERTAARTRHFTLAAPPSCTGDGGGLGAAEGGAGHDGAAGAIRRGKHSSGIFESSCDLHFEWIHAYRAGLERFLHRILEVYGLTPHDSPSPAPAAPPGQLEHTTSPQLQTVPGRQLAPEDSAVSNRSSASSPAAANRSSAFLLTSAEPCLAPLFDFRARASGALSRRALYKTAVCAGVTGFPAASSVCFSACAAAAMTPETFSWLNALALSLRAESVFTRGVVERVSPAGRLKRLSADTDAGSQAVAESVARGRQAVREAESHWTHALESLGACKSHEDHFLGEGRTATGGKPHPVLHAFIKVRFLTRHPTKDKEGVLPSATPLALSQAAYIFRHYTTEPLPFCSTSRRLLGIQACLCRTFVLVTTFLMARLLKSQVLTLLSSQGFSACVRSRTDTAGAAARRPGACLDAAETQRRKFPRPANGEILGSRPAPCGSHRDGPSPRQSEPANASQENEGCETSHSGDIARLPGGMPASDGGLTFLRVPCLGVVFVSNGGGCGVDAGVMESVLQIANTARHLTRQFLSCSAELQGHEEVIDLLPLWLEASGGPFGRGHAPAGCWAAVEDSWREGASDRRGKEARASRFQREERRCQRSELARFARMKQRTRLERASARTSGPPATPASFLVSLDACATCLSASSTSSTSSASPAVPSPALASPEPNTDSRKAASGGNYAEIGRHAKHEGRHLSSQSGSAGGGSDTPGSALKVTEAAATDRVPSPCAASPPRSAAAYPAPACACFVRPFFFLHRLWPLLRISAPPFLLRRQSLTRRAGAPCAQLREEGVSSRAASYGSAATVAAPGSTSHGGSQRASSPGLLEGTVWDAEVNDAASVMRTVNAPDLNEQAEDLSGSHPLGASFSESRSADDAAAPCRPAADSNPPPQEKQKSTAGAQQEGGENRQGVAMDEGEEGDIFESDRPDTTQQRWATAEIAEAESDVERATSDYRHASRGDGLSIAASHGVSTPPGRAVTEVVATSKTEETAREGRRDQNGNEATLQASSSDAEGGARSPSSTHDYFVFSSGTEAGEGEESPLLRRALPRALLAQLVALIEQCMNTPFPLPPRVFNPKCLPWVAVRATLSGQEEAARGRCVFPVIRFTGELRDAQAQVFAAWAFVRLRLSVATGHGCVQQSALHNTLPAADKGQGVIFTEDIPVTQPVPGCVDAFSAAAADGGNQQTGPYAGGVRSFSHTCILNADMEMLPCLLVEAVPLDADRRVIGDRSSTFISVTDSQKSMPL
ncbi:hypothetical protein BESB_046110 [Besnoitia besnoiti]|uniref:Uncharacterized protein n=1 Tax=Besnoitia besnoiti TaxID=94643 RepID=A0A2A9MEW4_BESBE|nr:hypothetical protein BESB_046110 [Besnoitia besnoiti]PFH36419.1 hypothetical protein BESB_046110 [Besnoitia besnoiti]